MDGNSLFRIEIRGGSNANGSNYGWTQVGEECPRKGWSPPRHQTNRVPHKMCGQDIDMKLVRADIREFSRHLMKAFVPERHGMMIPFDFVADVRCLFLLRANSKANFITRSTPRRVKTVCCTAISSSVPS